jgi:hypothetical protein
MRQRADHKFFAADWWCASRLLCAAKIVNLLSNVFLLADCDFFQIPPALACKTLVGIAIAEIKMNKINLYIGVTIGLILTAVLATYYFTSIKTERSNPKGYEISMFRSSCGPDPIFIENIRKFRTFTLTADTAANEQTLQSMRTFLNDLKTSYDSINGVHVVLTNDMPYKYYIKSIEIFNQLPPRLFFTLKNSFYAISKSKYQQTQDSILKAKADKEGIGVVDIDGNEH